ncbi:sel1 repeat family protein [Polaromonas sp.]|uniref:sel1 repeat family protein n=1 Tax=Polaromonas sp. TaxID=1869339 RepID=UPI00352B1F3E
MRYMLRPALLAAAFALGPAGNVHAQAAATTSGAVNGNAARASVTTGAGVTGASTAGTAVTPAQAGVITNSSTGAGARYVESCQQAIERGVVSPGCQGPLYASEIARLKEDALRSNNPNLLTLLGDAYQSNRSGISDIGQAYRWYLLGAVRGDPRAMQRLSELYRNGSGAPRDNIKALGYARLAERLAPPGSTSAKQATEAVTSLGNEMAAEEVVLADRFASELENTIRRQGPTGAGEPASTTPVAEPKTARTLSNLPGMGAAQADSSARVSPAAGGTLPGRESLSGPGRQP